MADGTVMEKVIIDNEDCYRLGVICLAAGASRRFKGVKQLVELGEGGMLQKTLNNLSQLCSVQRLVTLGANKDLILNKIKIPNNVHICFVPDWQTGISASIRTGITELKNCSHCLIMLADQPQVQISSYTQLIAASRRNLGSIVCAFYRQKNAVPAIFPRSCFSLLLQLKGDKGAGRFLNSPDIEQELLSIPMDMGAIDIDTPQDLIDWRQNYNV